MSFYGKTYNYVSHENFDAWLKGVGLPDDKIALIISEKSSVKVEKNGDSYVLTQSNAKGSKVTTFKPEVEIDDTIGDDNTPIKSTFTVDGNTFTQVITTPLGKATFKRIYDGDNLVVEIIGDKYDGVAKRFYKA